MLTSLINVQYCYDYLVNQIPINLLFYTHLTIIIVSLFFGIFLLFKTRSLPSVMLFLVCLSFVVWVVLDLTTWFAFLGSGNTMFTWELIYPFTLIFFFFSYYFLYTFSTDRDLPTWQKILGMVVMAPTFVWAFLGSSLVSFDGNTCEALENGMVNNYYFIAQGIFFVATMALTIILFIKTKEKIKRKESLLAGLGVLTFLSFFLFTGLAVNLLADYDIVQYAYNFSIYGLLGMPLLLGFLIYLIVKFKAFDVKLLATQALVWSLVILIGAEFFFIQNNINRILTAITLVIGAWLGLVIIRSVKNEVAQKEHIEKINVELKKLNDDKSEFVSFASHQIRTPLTSIKGYSANILDGDYGELNPELKDAVQKILVRGTDAVTLISQYLDKSKMELGQLKYDFADFDIVELAKSVTKGFEPNAEQAKLALKFNSGGLPTCIVNADKGKVKEVIGNLIDNAIKYTPSGSIEVSVFKKDSKVIVKFSDTGVGMSKAVITDLYRKFGRAKDAAKTNILGNGLGLFLAKTFMEAMNGRSWAESEGDGKGSQFYIELPVKVEEVKTAVTV